MRHKLTLIRTVARNGHGPQSGRGVADKPGAADAKEAGRRDAHPDGAGAASAFDEVFSSQRQLVRLFRRRRCSAPDPCPLCNRRGFADSGRGAVARD